MNREAGNKKGKIAPFFLINEPMTNRDNANKNPDIMAISIILFEFCLLLINGLFTV